MNIIRRSILAAALIAGIVPAFAQVPPAVPALPDTERRTTYTLTAQTCACAVGFALYGDSTDYQNWVEVFLNGVRVNFNDSTFGWTITSPTGSLGSIPRPVTDAVLTFTNAQTGTVQIVGARRPRRVSQFTENRGVAARDLNQVLTDLTAQNRETWDKINDVTGRGLFGLPGENIGLMPSASARAGGFLAFDAFGNPKITQPTTGTGNVIGTGPTVVGNLVIWNNTTGTSINDTGVAFGTQPQNRVLATPSGSSGVPSFRALVGSDLPIVPTANGGAGVSNSTNTANDVLASNGTNGNFVHSALLTVLNTVCGLSPTTCASVFGYSNVVWFGATGNGSTDDTTALQACHTTGAVCYYPPGTYKFTTLSIASGGITGAGPQSFLVSNDTSSSNLITYTGNGAQANVPLFTHFFLQGTFPKTQGAGIGFSPGATDLTGPIIDGVTFFAIPISVDLLNCESYSITNSQLTGYRIAGVRITNTNNIDAGDGQISGNYINTGTGLGAGALWQSGGGVRFYGNKVNGGAIGFQAASNFTGATGDLNIYGNSIENAVTAGISLGRASGTGTYGGINIVSNQIAITPAPIVVDTSGAISLLNISGNVLVTNGVTSTVAVQLGTTGAFTAVGNTISCNSGTTTTGIISGASSTNGKVGGNLIVTCSTAQTLGGTNISTTF